MKNTRSLSNYKWLLSKHENKLRALNKCTQNQLTGLNIQQFADKVNYEKERIEYFKNQIDTKNAHDIIVTGL